METQKKAKLIKPDDTVNQQECRLTLENFDSQFNILPTVLFCIVKGKRHKTKIKNQEGVRYIGPHQMVKEKNQQVIPLWFSGKYQSKFFSLI